MHLLISLMQHLFMKSNMEINLICIGKIKEDYIKSGIIEYQKRIKPFCTFNIIELKEVNKYDDNRNMEEEAKEILSVIKDNTYLITLEIEGKMLSSVELANLISDHYTYSSDVIYFVIGGSAGLSLSVKERSNYHLSFSKMTFPHQLMRLVFTEQLYRALSIINNMKYHK